MGDKRAAQTILCVWEIGAELGHISKLCSIAKTMESQNYKVVVALKDLSRAYPFFSETQTTLLQAPVWLPKISMQRPIACLADTLLLLGYLETDPLHTLVMAWQSLIELVKPDLVIFDYSPTAMLALHNNPIPKILVGSGFADPVPGLPIQDWRPYPTKDNLVARQEQRVLQQINAVLTRQGKTKISSLSDLFSVNETLIHTFPELDLYGDVRTNATYCVQPTDTISTNQVTFPNSEKPKILAYLKPGYPQFKQLVAALAQCRADVFIACPNGPAELLQTYVGEHFQFSVELVDLPNAMAAADLFVGHGNAASVKESLVARTPVVVLPVQLEQLLIGKKIQQLGCGVLIEQVNESQDVVNALDKILKNLQPYRSAVQHLVTYFTKPVVSVADAASAACARLLDSSKSV